MMSPSQIVHALGGSKRVDGCTDRDPFTCWICGHASTRGMPRVKWQGHSFTGQNRVRCAESLLVCEACIVVMSGKPPDTERMSTHLVEGSSHERVNKGQKPRIREFLRGAHREAWFAAIADSGQKHILPWTPINAGGQPGGVVLFEEALVTLPRDPAGWSLLDQIAGVLTAGATKEEIKSGDYSARAWTLVGRNRLAGFEATCRALRGGAWFDLAVWLAQRDEAAVMARMESEKEAKREAQRRRKGKAQKPHGRSVARDPIELPADAGVQCPEALGPAPGPDARGGADDRQPRAVADDDDAHAATHVAGAGQLALF